MDFGRAFSYAFEDADWLKKAGIAALVFLIPVVGPIILAGWGLEIMRRVIKDEPVLLPDWSDFGGFVGTGFKGVVVQLAYSLPLLLVVGCWQVLNFGLVAALSESNPDALGMGTTVLMLCMGCVVFFLVVLTGLLVPPALGNMMANDGQLGAAFRFGEVFGLLRAAVGPYLLSVILSGLLLTVLSPLGSLVCGVGLLAVAAYYQLFSNHLFGQAYKQARAGLPVV
ncbi:MAG: DUF4013 domain-containing protein [Anaerolineales bacterium]|nr:DUF4013 domain-containing protein [Anaerolineales bacterium]MDW8277156.1 DUF4013 domain-containing protein [Anaerolineales bacterium]